MVECANLLTILSISHCAQRLMASVVERSGFQLRTAASLMSMVTLHIVNNICIVTTQ